MIVPLYSSLGNRVGLTQKTNKQKNKWKLKSPAAIKKKAAKSALFEMSVGLPRCLTCNDLCDGLDLNAQMTNTWRPLCLMDYISMRINVNIK